MSLDFHLEESLDVKKVFWLKTYDIPGTSWTIRGYSKSAYRTGFYIKELDMMLDAGPQNFKRPQNIFITHSHMDHMFCLPGTLIAQKNEHDITPPVVNIYVPEKAEKHIYRYINNFFAVNSLISPRPQSETDSFYRVSGKKIGDILRLNANNTDLEVEIFKCDHSVPTISYGFSVIKTKLKEEYLGLSGKDIVELKKSGIEILKEVTEKKLAYVCDTSINVFKMNLNIIDYPVIFIECTFLYPDEIQLAKDKKHIHWDQLKPIVLSNSKTTFVLFHFSQRYKDLEIAEFFEKQNINNIYWW